MALINCPECEKEVSDEAENCPNCGHPIKEKNSDDSSSTGKNWFYGLMIIIGGGWALLGFGNIFEGFMNIAESGDGTGMMSLNLLVNVVLFILPGLVVSGIGIKNYKTKKQNSLSSKRIGIAILIIVIGATVFWFYSVQSNQSGSGSSLFSEETRRVNSRRIADLRQIQNHLELRYDSEFGYPSNIIELEKVFNDSEVSVPTEDPTGSEYKYSPVDSNDDGLNESYQLGVCVNDMGYFENIKNASCNQLACTLEGEMLCLTPEL